MGMVKCFGSLSCESVFDSSVSISYDTTEHDTTAKYKIMVQIEPPEISDITKGVIDNKDNFDLILTWNPEILGKCSNAKQFLFGTCWIDINTFKPNKTNQISFLTSNKRWSNADGHNLRHEIYNMLGDNYNEFSVTKMMTPPRIVNKDVMFINAKYSIIVENTSRVNWITEKLIDCLATKTIPIYYGCPNVGEFFNEKGILTFTTIEELIIILNEITPQSYTEMGDIIDENYEKSKEYHDFHIRVENEVNNLINGK